MERGEEIDYFPKWKTQRGVPTKAMLLEFIAYYKVGESYFQWEESSGIVYEGQIWKCKIDHKVKELCFKVKVDLLDIKSRNYETSLEENKKPLIDRVPNPIVDSWEEVELGIVSKDLFPNLFIIGQYITILQDLVKQKNVLSPLAKTRLDLIKCRSSKKLRKLFTQYKEYDRKLKSEIRRLIYKKLY